MTDMSTTLVWPISDQKTSMEIITEIESSVSQEIQNEGAIVTFLRF